MVGPEIAESDTKERPDPGNSSGARPRKRQRRSGGQTSPQGTMGVTKSPKKTRRNSIGSEQGMLTRTQQLPVTAPAAAAAAAPPTAGPGAAAAEDMDLGQPTVVVPEDKAPVTADFMLRMEERIKSNFASRLSVIESHVLNNTQQIKNVKENFEARESLLEGRINAQLVEQRKSLEAKIKNLAKSASTAPPASRSLSTSGMDGSARGITTKQEESFHHHRRSLRIWPIKGPEIGKNLKTFLQARLKIVGPALEGLGKMEFRREKIPNSRYPDEVVVLFESKDVRDSVKAAGYHLAGDPNVGMRPSIPGFLLDNHRVLAAIGYSIKSSQTDAKRSIKFDDENLDLFLDIKVNEEWTRITPREAREAARANPSIKIGPRKLTGEDITALVASPNLVPIGQQTRLPLPAPSSTIVSANAEKSVDGNTVQID